MFPINKLRPAQFQIMLAQNLRSSGASLADGGQVADFSGGGHWLGSMKNFALSTEEHHRLWRAVMLEFSNGIGEMVMPIIDHTNSHLVGGTFTVVGNVARGATQMTIANPEGKIFGGGEYLSVQHSVAGWRAYSVKLNPTVRVGSNQTVKFLPRIRQAIPSGTVIEIEQPRLVVRLTCPPGEAWPEVQAPFKARPSIQFAESAKWQELL